MPDDIEFVKKASAGDKSAFGRLYEIYLNRIYRFVYYLVNDEFLAEDITQNTFMKAWNGLAHFSIAKGTFQSYLYTIARNLVIDNQRKKKEISLEIVVENDAAIEENPEEKIWRQDAMQKVRNSLSGFPEDDRQIIIWRYFEDLQFDEIAKILGKKSGAIRVKVHRLLQELKDSLEQP